MNGRSSGTSRLCRIAARAFGCDRHVWGGSSLLPVPAVQQYRELGEQKLVEVAHLRETLPRLTFWLRSGNASVGGLSHRCDHFVLVGVEDGPGVVAQPVMLAATS